MKTTLLVLAAGLGSRFGGDKQISHVGPQGEILMEYSIHDAIEAGFNKVVFVLKDEMVDTVKNTVGEKFKDRVELEYATQDYSSLPDFYVLPPERVKPFGTVHAVLCAKEYLTEPFATVNADDYYGKECFVLMHDFLTRLKGASDAAMVTYILKNTVSDNGAVTRGICSVKDGKLVKVDETGGIVPKDGVIVGENGEIDPESEVSMNFWGFHQDVLGRMQRYFEDFLKGLKPDEIKAECLLPVMVNDLLASGEMTVLATPSHDKWFGITYKADKEDVENKLKALHESGVYPPQL
ncbi:MAG TPA: NTP transferase domain-containing protein [Candidatus Faeciplasma gallinarum]|uniref:NTP transferase domain-containing protein n=1 Tax=Candidatus Faeciplasma gallinarum TaxID=2840799 RepID=A0A9D1ENV7_9FIRM|nr:NTP transferase domain-containing protein [Candidatus Faeciplasma gallinarum]